MWLGCGNKAKSRNTLYPRMMLFILFILILQLDFMLPFICIDFQVSLLSAISRPSIVASCVASKITIQTKASVALYSFLSAISTRVCN
ncbi:hypothetical protein BDZ89DRAFT_395655 [Hymenopellis radicata]|nr:hypothetical protein BDZ89DRAFT_395655 [Hymenopellis radicata]